ncbi:DUF5817 domain-containing protein [Methanolobus sp. WCC5]|uniref:DUF5817 domain-containing protein n=1 Tax=Methanolobus sp. WCC5 TaxID=3125785 RepID=UPI003244EE51
MAYGVVVCTRCRKQAQIIDVGSSKTIRCQRCNSNLATRKLRLFFSSDNLEEAISVRTQIQARISESGTYPLQTESIDARGKEYQTFGDELNDKTACLINNRKKLKKKTTYELILSILRSAGNRMPYEELRKEALSMDIEGPELDDTLTKMLDAGEIYKPSKDTIGLV